MKRLLIVMFIALTGCGQPSCGQPHVPSVLIEPSDTHMCQGACMNLRRLKCPEGDPLPDGTTCEQFCVETQRNGHSLNLMCMSTINKCEQQESCLVPRDPLQ